jgi:hypothetical protein
MAHKTGVEGIEDQMLSRKKEQYQREKLGASKPKINVAKEWVSHGCDRRN